MTDLPPFPFEKQAVRAKTRDHPLLACHLLVAMLTEEGIPAAMPEARATSRFQDNQHVELIAITGEPITPERVNAYGRNSVIPRYARDDISEEIEREAVAQGPIRVGEAVVTSAGRLPYRAVVHAAAMGYADDGSLIPATAERVYAATRAALARCAERDLRTVAFPALGTGVGGLDLATCAQAMVQAVRDHATHGAALPQHIVFVVRNEEAAEAFRRAIAS